MPTIVSAIEFLVAWRALGLGEPPLVLHACLGDEHALSEPERTQLVASTMAGLRERGLADVAGPVPAFAAALTTLARPRWAIEARLRGGHPDATETANGSMRAYGAAGQGDAATIAALTDGTVTLTTSTWHRLPAGMVALAGDIRPGNSRSINLPAEVLRAAVGIGGNDAQRVAGELIACGVPAGDASAIARINAEHRRGGQFAVQVAGEDGTMRPGHRVIGFTDTEHGRWVGLRSGQGDDREWLTFTPASTAQLVTMITELLPGLSPIP